MELDENGLGRVHIRYLRILQKNGVCGFGTMVGLLGTTDEDVIEYEIEPRLVALGLIEKTQKGRRITTDGLVYVSKSSQP